jgi:hypothetical protein
MTGCREPNPVPHIDGCGWYNEVEVLMEGYYGKQPMRALIVELDKSHLTV